MIVYRRKLPIEVATVEWTGHNDAELASFTSGGFLLVDPEDGEFAPDITAKVYDELHDSWIGVKTGQHIVRGPRGENYPIDAGVLAETTEVVAS